MRKGTTQSEEVKKKISQTLKGRIKTQEHLTNVSKALKGRKLSEEHRNNLSIAHIGYKHSEETKRKIGRKGSKSASWKGGQYKSRGRILIYSPEHPFAREKYVRKSRLVMENKLGRYLKPCEVVHHINGVKDDDRPDNLKLFPNQAAHAKLHYEINSKTGVYPSGRFYSLH